MYTLTDQRLGDAAAEMYRMVSGQPLTDAERKALVEMLTEGEGGKWAQPTYQLAWFGNDTAPLLAARVLAGAFILDEVVVWTSRLARSSANAFYRLRDLVDGAEALRLNVRKMSAANGAQRIEFINGGQVGFLTRTRNAIRGMSADCFVMDESRGALAEVVAYVRPCLVTRPNPQLVIAHE